MDNSDSESTVHQLIHGSAELGGAAVGGALGFFAAGPAGGRPPKLQKVFRLRIEGCLHSVDIFGDRLVYSRGRIEAPLSCFPSSLPTEAATIPIQLMAYRSDRRGVKPIATLALRGRSK